jgi:hypothetical protein
MSGEKYIMGSLVICTPHQYFSGDQIEKIEMGRHVAQMVARYIQVWVMKPDEKRPLGRPMHKLEDNIKN